MVGGPSWLTGLHFVKYGPINVSFPTRIALKRPGTKSPLTSDSLSRAGCLAPWTSWVHLDPENGAAGSGGLLRPKSSCLVWDGSLISAPDVGPLLNLRLPARSQRMLWFLPPPVARVPWSGGYKMMVVARAIACWQGRETAQWWWAFRAPLGAAGFYSGADRPFGGFPLGHPGWGGVSH